LRVRLHLPEHPRQGGEECVDAAKESIVRPGLARMLPQPFRGIQFRRVGRQLMDLQPMPVGLEPVPYIGVFVVGGVVLNQNGPLAAIAPRELFEEAEIAARVEDSVLPIVESRAPEFDGPENLHAFALAGNRYFRRATDAAPGGVQGRVLPEAGFVGENQRPVPRPGFFLRFG